MPDTVNTQKEMTIPILMSLQSKYKIYIKGNEWVKTDRTAQETRGKIGQFDRC